MPTISGLKKSRAAEFIARRIYNLRARRSQGEIARIAGFDSVNMISMIKSGTTKVPLARVVDLARALDCDKSHLMRLALEQHLPTAVVETIVEALGGLFSSNEVAIIERIRELSKNGDPELSPRIDGSLVEAFGHR